MSWQSACCPHLNWAHLGLGAMHRRKNNPNIVTKTPRATGVVVEAAAVIRVADATLIGGIAAISVAAVEVLVAAGAEISARTAVAVEAVIADSRAGGIKVRRVIFQSPRRACA